MYGVSYWRVWVGCSAVQAVDDYGGNTMFLLCTGALLFGIGMRMTTALWSGTCYWLWVRREQIQHAGYDPTVHSSPHSSDPAGKLSCLRGDKGTFWFESCIRGFTSVSTSIVVYRSALNAAYLLPPSHWDVFANRRHRKQAAKGKSSA